MARICSQCNLEVADGMSFCTNCGARMPEGNNLYPSAPVVPSVQPDSNGQQVDKVVELGIYFGIILLFSLPVIGFISAIILSFAPQNKNIKNFARAALIWMVIAVVLMSIMAFALLTIVNTVVSNVYSAVTESSGGIEDLQKQFGDLQGYIDQFENSGLTMPAQ